MKYFKQTVNFLQGHYTLIVALFIFFGLASCSPHCNRGVSGRFEEGMDTFLLGVGQLLNLAIFGTTSLGFGLAYSKRKKREAHGMLIFSILLFMIFGNFTLRGLFFYGYDFVDHPILATLYCISAIFMAVIVIFVYKGLNRSSESFKEAAKKKKSAPNTTDFLEDEISEEDEII